MPKASSQLDVSLLHCSLLPTSPAKMTVEIPFVRHAFDASEATDSIRRLASFLFQDAGASEGEIRVTRLTEGTTNAVRFTRRTAPCYQSLTCRDL